MSLAARISLLIVALALSISLLDAWLLGQRLTDNLNREQERLVRTLTRSIGEATARAVLTRNVLATRETLRNIVKVSPELEYAYIIDFDGRLFADSFDRGFPSALMTLKHVREGQLRRAEFRDGDRLMSDVAYPLVAGLDAELHLGFNHDYDRRSIVHGQRELILTAGAIGVFGILVALWYGRRLSQPMASLRRQLEAYGGGRLDRPEPIASRDRDVTALWHSFDAMVHERQQLDDRLRDSERYNRMLFETSPVGLALTSMDGRLVDVNAAYAAILGRTTEETLGLTYWQITPEDYANQERAQLARLQAHKRYGPYEKEYLHKDGHRVPVRLNGLLIERHGEQFIWSAVEDITAERAADERQRMLSTMLEASPDFAGTATLDGRIVYVNRGGRRMLGVGEDEPLVDRPIAGLHPEWAFRIIAEQGIPVALREGMWRGESALLSSEGREIPVAMSIVSHEDATGKPYLVSAIMTDVSDLKAKEQELLVHRRHLEELVEARTQEIRQQARIIDQTHDAVITCDLDGAITSWNHGAEQLFGLGATQALDEHLELIFPTSERAGVPTLIDRVRERRNLEVEQKLQRADGDQLQAHVSLSLLYDERHEPSGLAAYALDISERKRAEKELVKLATDLKLANQELESFTYSVSHDLRSPLRALDGFSLALLQDYGDRLDATAHGYLNRVRLAAQHMGQLIDDLLQLSRVSRGKLRRQTVDLSAMATEILERLRDAEPDRDVTVNIEPGLTARGDPGMLRVVLDNLLGNAWKYTAKRDRAEIRFARKAGATGTEFVIQDNGAGFNMAYVDKLFGPFQRLHHSDEFPGTGVGLATVARIVRRHNGTVRAEAEVDKGASFYVNLPDDRQAEKPSQQHE